MPASRSTLRWCETVGWPTSKSGVSSHTQTLPACFRNTSTSWTRIGSPSAFATLALQVLLTRLLSAVFLYHFAFLAISLALLGTGGGALLVYVRERRGDAGPVEPLLARYGIAFAVFLLVLPIVLSNLHYAAGGL